MLNSSIIETLSNLIKESCNDSSTLLDAFHFVIQDNYVKVMARRNGNIDEHTYPLGHSAGILDSLSNMVIKHCTSWGNYTDYSASHSNGNYDQGNVGRFVYGFTCGLLVIGLVLRIYCKFKSCIKRITSKVVNECSCSTAITDNNNVYVLGGGGR